MKYTFNCPSCGASLEKQSDNPVLFCSYCGQKIDLGNEITINKNIKVQKSSYKTLHKRYTDDTEMLRIKTEDEQDKRNSRHLFIFFAVLLVIAIAIPCGFAIHSCAAREEGKIQAGYYKDLVGLNYQSVEAHFRSAGFTDIELIDLNDAGIAFWTEGQVATISVGGNMSFETTDWFSPDTKVIISYH